MQPNVRMLLFDFFSSKIISRKGDFSIGMDLWQFEQTKLKFSFFILIDEVSEWFLQTSFKSGRDMNKSSFFQHNSHDDIDNFANILLVSGYLKDFMCSHFSILLFILLI